MLPFATESQYKDCCGIHFLRISFDNRKVESTGTCTSSLLLLVRNLSSTVVPYSPVYVLEHTSSLEQEAQHVICLSKYSIIILKLLAPNHFGGQEKILGGQGKILDVFW